MDYNEELKKIVQEPAKQLIEKMEEHYDRLDFEQKKDLEKLKFGIKIFELEQQEKAQREKSTYKWN